MTVAPAKISKKAARACAKKFFEFYYGKGEIYFSLPTCGHMAEIAVLGCGFPVYRARVNRLGKMYVYDVDYYGEPDKLRYTVNLLKRKPRHKFVR